MSYAIPLFNEWMIFFSCSWCIRVVALVNSLGSVIFSTSDGLFFRPRVGYVRSTEMRIFGANAVLNHSVSGGLVQAVAVALLPYLTRGKMTIDENYDDNVPDPRR